MEDDLRPRIGTFFILIGLGLLALFIGSDMAFQANFWYFMASVGCIGFGAYLKIISSREKGPSQRFGAIRSYREKRKKEKEAKKKAKEEQAKESETPKSNMNDRSQSSRQPPSHRNHSCHSRVNYRGDQPYQVLGCHPILGNTGQYRSKSWSDVYRSYGVVLVDCWDFGWSGWYGLDVPEVKSPSLFVSSFT